MRKQLIIQLARFGDLLQTKRLVLTLMAEGETHICLDRSMSELASIIYPGVIVHPLAVHGKLTPEALAGNQRIFERLAEEKFDDIYNLNYSGFSQTMARLFPTESVHGYAMDGAQATRAPWVRLIFRLTRTRRLSPINLVDFWACFAKNPVSPNLVNPSASGGGRGLGIVLAGREARRSLPPPLMARNAETFFDILDGPPVFIFGGADQQPLARRLMRDFSPKMLEKTENLTGKTDLPGLTQALNGLDMLLSPDTGVMHLAAHLGVPVFAFFLSSAWCFETGPYGLGHHVAQANIQCVPCLESARCHKETAPPCLSPFADPLLRGIINARFAPQKILGASPPPPEGLMLLSSALDELGGCWQAVRGEDRQALERTALRALLAEYAGAAACRPAYAEMAGRLYQEADWVLGNFMKELT